MSKFFNTFLKIALIAGAGYVAYQYFSDDEFQSQVKESSGKVINLVLNKVTEVYESGIDTPENLLGSAESKAWAQEQWNKVEK